MAGSGYANLAVSNTASINGVNPQLLNGLNQLAAKYGQIQIISGYRSPSYSAKVGGYSNDPHTRGEAVDAYINGKPIGDVIPLNVLQQAGLQGGNQPGFYPAGGGNGSDPEHVQIPGSGVDKNLASPALGGATGVTATGNTPPPGGLSASSYFAQVLTDMGIKPTPGAIKYLQSWSQNEGTSALNNPLATTQPAPGATSFNSVGVRNYPTPTLGAQATADTLKNGRYPGIVQALSSPDPFAAQQSIPGIGQQLSTWSGSGYTSVSPNGYVPKDITGASSAQPPAAVAPTLGAPQPQSAPAVPPPPDPRVIAAQQTSALGSQLAQQLLGSARQMLNGGTPDLQGLFAAAKGFQQARGAMTRTAPLGATTPLTRAAGLKA